jgi:ATP-dependent Clp protease adapter protein ClpS
MDVHNQGSAVAGIYSLEIAEQKVVDATQLSRNNGWPLLLNMEPE